MFAAFFTKTLSFAFRQPVAQNSIKTRSISMLLVNRTGTLNNNSFQKQNSLTSPHTLAKFGTESELSSSFSMPNMIQLITRRFLKVNFKSSQLKKKRKFGFKARLKTNGGRKVIVRKRVKGRKYLSH